MASDWCWLPQDILTLIAMKMETLQDFIYFSAVCSWWNHVSSLIIPEWNKKVVPHLFVVESNKDNTSCVRKIVDVRNNKCYEMNLPENMETRCWGSAYGWIAMVDHDMNVRLLNPITKAQINFPCFKTLPKPIPRLYDVGCFWHFYLSKLIVLKVSQSDHHYYEFIIMAIYNFGAKSLAFARSGDESWTSIITKETSVVTDAMSTNDFVFLSYEDGSMGFCHVDDFFGHEEVLMSIHYSPPHFEIPEMFKGYFHKMYLVKSGVDFLMILRDMFVDTSSSKNIGVASGSRRVIKYHTDGFSVYKFHSKDKSWEIISELGDVALFVGCNYSMSFSCARVKKLKPSCIYYTDDAAQIWEVKTGCGGHDIGIYETGSLKIEQLYQGQLYQGDDIKCPPLWFIPQL